MTPEEKEKQKVIENAYKSAIEKIPDKKLPADPWGAVRSNHTIVTNCTTHVYGRMSSPATIQATQELMAAKGGAADDIARLTRGEFYSTSRPQ